MDASTPRDRYRQPAPLVRATDEARRLIRRAQLALAAAALAAAVPVAMIVAEQAAERQSAALIPAASADPLLTGVLAGLTTLFACWGLLAVAGSVWRARLAARDRRDWAADWARVEPSWSGRLR